METLNHEKEEMFEIQKYKKEYDDSLLIFLRTCLPESGRRLELHGRHKMYGNIEAFFEDFWCLLDGENIIGTVALKRLDEDKCELKSLYLLQQYHGRKLGFRLLKTAISKARSSGYKEMYLDTLSTSREAISLYKKMGFVLTERYNSNDRADVFMVLRLDASEDEEDKMLEK